MSKVDIPLSEQQHGQLTEKMARLACAAYYRAKLEPLYFGKSESLDLERRLKKIVEENWTDWIGSAKAFLSMAYVIIKEDDFLSPIRDRIADLEAQRERAGKDEKLSINGKIGLLQAVIHDYERIKSDGE